MEKIEPGILLERLIREKEAEHEAEGKVLKAELLLVAESFRPANLIKSTFRELISKKGIQAGLIDSAIGISTGFLAKKVFVNDSHSPLKKMLGFVLEMAVAKKVTENAPDIKKITGIVLSKLIRGLRGQKK